ncbi:hypothetical protein [Candidatus Similichlamydia laticola]|uniref:Signal recognition particle receptor protein FtsY n=1 Tax=Candidatus Similichlamydia laticola TaxID=2170265 RepID=A0A369KIG8_9BACT|nr:hypothetical protein [Candidatus Similichlamydia laticola]RDB31583.1 Signal recognition particle receptor protein FtsY [Candidatus Similichlamydia laticola]
MIFRKLFQRLKTCACSNSKKESLPPPWLGEALLSANTNQKVVDRLLSAVRYSGQGKGSWEEVVREELLKMVPREPFCLSKKRPQVFFFLGENGHGKTTSCAKVARYFLQQNNRPFLIASDTFRAAAGEQLQFWADTLDIPCFQGKPKADPASVVFQGMQKALAEERDVILIDTSGRLSNNQNLMMELKKSVSIAHKFLSADRIHSLLILDSSLGQYASIQALKFSDQLRIAGYIFTRSERPSGTLFSVLEVRPLPIAFLSLGGNIEDLSLFDPMEYTVSFLESLKEC